MTYLQTALLTTALLIITFPPQVQAFTETVSGIANSAGWEIGVGRSGYSGIKNHSKKTLLQNKLRPYK